SPWLGTLSLDRKNVQSPASTTRRAPGRVGLGCMRTRTFASTTRVDRESPPMATYTATVLWTRQPGAPFTDNKYSRSHEWRCGGGPVVPASSSPKVVPVPLSRQDAVDPEEAFIAAISSCHMLFVLFFAAKAGLTINRYEDEAIGEVGKTASGATAVL